MCVNLESSTRTRRFRTGQKKYIRRALKCVDSMLLRTCSRLMNSMYVCKQIPYALVNRKARSFFIVNYQYTRHPWKVGVLLYSVKTDIIFTKQYLIRLEYFDFT